MEKKLKEKALKHNLSQSENNTEEEKSMSIDKLESKYEEEEESKSYEAIKLNVEETKTDENTYHNILVVGASNIGKSSFIEMFIKKLKGEIKYKYDALKPEKDKQGKIYNILDETSPTTDFKEHQFTNNKLTLTMIDSPGYGDTTDIDEWRANILNHLKSRMDNFRGVQSVKKNQKITGFQETFQNKKRLKDQRIHLILFIFDGPRAKEQDMLSCQEFDKHAKIVPLIAKSETFTTDELKKTKQLIMKRGEQYNVDFYEVRDENIIDGDHQVPPFGIINPSHILETKDGKRIFGRQYSYGFSNAIDNSDFIQLQQLVNNKEIRKELLEIMKIKYERIYAVDLNGKSQEKKLKPDGEVQDENPVEIQQMTTINKVTGAVVGIFSVTAWGWAFINQQQ